jgi:hypothetical protein
LLLLSAHTKVGFHYRGVGLKRDLHRQSLVFIIPVVAKNS